MAERKDSLGKRLNKLREEKNLTQKQLGIILSVSAAAIGTYENDKKNPPNDTLIKIADFFNVSTDYLLCRTDDSRIKSLKNKLSKEFLEAGIEDIGILKNATFEDLSSEDLEDLLKVANRIKKNHNRQ
jgi:transcriptional regulator with XRE-family HTH domain